MDPSGTVMQQIADWLIKLGMSEYVERFAENDIEIDVLSELTDQDLERLGVSLGHRRRMLRAIRELVGPAPAAAQPAVTEPKPQDTAERRQLTVMFCDLVGSTALSAGLDPEDMREVIRAYQDACSGAIARYDGFVAKFMGDGVLAYFGFPRAHEDDAERAVQGRRQDARAIPLCRPPWLGHGHNDPTVRAAGIQVGCRNRPGPKLLRDALAAANQGDAHLSADRKSPCGSTTSGNGDILPANYRVKHASPTGFILGSARPYASGGGWSEAAPRSLSCTSPTARSRACQRG